MAENTTPTDQNSAPDVKQPVPEKVNETAAQGSSQTVNEQAPVTAAAPVQQSEQQAVQQQVQNNAQKAGGQIPEMLKAAAGQPAVSSDEKIWGLISYVPLMALMALVLKPSSAFIRLHGRQGLLIFLIFFFSIFVYLVPYIGPVIGMIIHFAMIAVGIFSMYQAFIGNWWKIPVLGDIAELIPIEMFAKVTREAVVGAKVSEEIEQKSVEEEAAKAEGAEVNQGVQNQTDETETVQTAAVNQQQISNQTTQEAAGAEKAETGPKADEKKESGGEVQAQLPIADDESVGSK